MGFWQREDLVPGPQIPTVVVRGVDRVSKANVLDRRFNFVHLRGQLTSTPQKKVTTSGEGGRNTASRNRAELGLTDKFDLAW